MGAATTEIAGEQSLTVSGTRSTGGRRRSSNPELYSNVVVVQCDDQLNDFLKKAEDESLQAIFYFTAVWCGPCQFLWPDMKKLSEGLPNVKFYKIDIDESVERNMAPFVTL
uniref:Thioredoxin domain-containing protein n=1 Tax=Chenopodium quinoa TaxID=63459 RepID=A0A803N4W3_CHEQI